MQVSDVNMQGSHLRPNAESQQVTMAPYGTDSQCRIATERYSQDGCRFTRCCICSGLSPIIKDASVATGYIN
ncbi:hypothetical protein AB1N83_003251 [Pleurotus pulmonarius]